MRKYIAAAVLLIALFGIISCGARKDYYSAAEYAPIELGTSRSSITSWEGTGFSPEGPPGAAGQTAPVMRDMSALYGMVTAESKVPGLPYDDSAAAPSKPAAPNQTPEPVNRKLVKSSAINIKVDDLGKAAAAINGMMQSTGSYSSSTRIEEYRQEYLIRVPVTQYEAVINQVNSLGKVLNRSDTVEDVTLKYYDLEGRFNTRQELLRTYQSYLGKAKNIEEILSVEAKIAELQNEIDWYGAQLTKLADQVDYATIRLTVQGPAPSYDYYEPSVLDRIKDLFKGFGEFLKGAAVVIVGIVIYGIPIIAFTAILFWLLFGKVGLLRKLWRLISKKKEKQTKD